MDLSERASRPWIYLASSAVSKEQKAREIAEADGIREGLICMLSAVEPCWSFRLVKDRHGRCLGLQRAYRKCLHIYQYHVHPRFGFMHLRQQTWMPFNLHVCLNGREWLSRQLDEAGLQYHRRGNCFPWIEDVQRAQQLLDQQVAFKWERELSRMRAEMSPAIQEVLAPYQASYYWSIEESEWATDIMFASESALSTRYPSLIRHGIESFSSPDVMRFLGQRVPLHGPSHRNDKRAVVSDVKGRPEGIRIKHRLGRNSVKMYNKQGSVLRLETTLNNVRELKVPRRKNGKIEWMQMRKGVADARRRAEVSNQCNQRYAQALDAVKDKAPMQTLTDGLASAVIWKGQRVRGLNLFAQEDFGLLATVGRGEFLLNGFRNRDLQQLMYPETSSEQRRRLTAKITRRIRMLRAHGLVRKLPHTHRYEVTRKGRQVIAALIAARNADIAQLAKAA